MTTPAVGGAVRRPLRHATVAIVGMGLLGGSLALALRGKCAHLIGVVAPGHDEDAHALEARELVNELATLDEAAARASTIVLATPVQTIIDQVGHLASVVRPGMLVTDVGSTKAAVVDAMRRAAADNPDVDWIGGHPMAGGTTSGLADIRADLFADAIWAVCPVDGQHDSAAVTRLSELVTSVGATPEIWIAEAHDRAAALASHLPHVVAEALLHTSTSLTGSAVPALAARGWERATQSANGDPIMWRDVLATNGAAVAAATRQLARALTDTADELEAAAAISPAARQGC